MIKPKSYTLPEIKALWNKYDSISGLRILKDGKWKYVFGNQKQSLINATRAEVIQLSDTMTFPKYLEKVAGMKNGNKES